MPPHLHPRSRTTTSLFTTTLMLSFLVVAAPHLVSCPVDPRAHADAPDPTGHSTRRRRSTPDSETKTCNHVPYEDGQDQAVPSNRLPTRRECPVPKPSGLISAVLGTRERGESRGDNDREILKNVRNAIYRPQEKRDSR